MTLSMTGFARAKVAGYLIEIQTINKKGAELSLSLPRELALKESFIRKKLGTLLQRGHAFVKVFPEKGSDLKISKEACHKMHEYLTDIAVSLDPTYKVSFECVLKALLEFDVSKNDEGNEWEPQWESGLDGLWKSLLKMKEKEGEALVSDIRMRLDLISKAVNQVEVENKDAPELYGKKILDRLSGYNALISEDKERVLREVMIYSEKIDITEEVVRMRSHVSQLRKILSSSNEPIGRTIDFLIQEMMREANTMGSKAPSVEAMNVVIFIKGEIDKIGQQGKNIE